MKKKIHPMSLDILATCSCGNSLKIKSTIKKDILLDVCNKCHPFYTGTQKKLNIGGRVSKFKKRFDNIVYKK
ncbi:rpmE [Wigglesworthia glossinidia endosymbiont of Glossina brevipalpis]|uniref:Large ribosomal subunit protein bL31 n=1 Tax=Wigglesworthia glossinidia brevipalpis TaxID=36870 RepID=RL31_WIGBR|nr:RecName: Full=Large ribosomal subunit protein bL31; AltName: Full=50S ribosomal protein L31 [Wigglesworthia glossinidia endosymbiont of Glossina brevipalpis]BAC24425.1 rpmE [Wigglesworthia glossinidia endosymbiont of Glossina brevipalpis]